MSLDVSINAKSLLVKLLPAIRGIFIVGTKSRSTGRAFTLMPLSDDSPVFFIISPQPILVGASYADVTFTTPGICFKPAL